MVSVSIKKDLIHFVVVSDPGNMDKFRNFAKFIPHQILSVFLAKNAFFGDILNVNGLIIECGVFLGGGVLTWTNLSSIYERYNNIRRFVGFGTFTGFAGLSEKTKAIMLNMQFLAV